MNYAESRMVSLLEVRSRIGKGVESDPVRIVTEWFTPEGERVACVDPWIEASINDLHWKAGDGVRVEVPVEFLRAVKSASARDTGGTAR